LLIPRTYCNLYIWSQILWKHTVIESSIPRNCKGRSLKKIVTHFYLPISVKRLTGRGVCRGKHKVLLFLKKLTVFTDLRKKICAGNNWCRHKVLFREMMVINYWNLIKIERAIFEKTAVFLRGFVFVFVFSRMQFEGALCLKVERLWSSSSGVRKAYICTYKQTDTQTETRIPETTFSHGDGDASENV
jgi:hypothetical protein